MDKETKYDTVSNKEKFKTLTFKKKVEYIVDYYKWHIIGVIIAMLVIGEVVKIATAPPAHQYDVHVVVAGRNMMDLEKQDAVANDLLEKYNASLQLMSGNWEGMDPTTMAYDQKLMLLASVQEIDVYIMSTFKYETYNNIEDYDAFVALDTIPELASILEKYEDKLVVKKSVETGEEHVYGIKVDALSNLPGMVLGEEFVYTLFKEPKNIEQAVKVTKYLLE